MVQVESGKKDRIFREGAQRISNTCKTLEVSLAENFNLQTEIENERMKSEIFNGDIERLHSEIVRQQ